MLKFVFVLIIISLSFVENANILFVTTFPAHSHQSVFQPIWEGLSLKGHKVTVIASHPLNNPKLTNLTEIDTSFLLKNRDVDNVPKWLIKYLLNKPGFLTVFLRDIFATYYFSQTHDDILTHPPVQALIKSENVSFDLVIAEWLFPTASAFSVKFNCPLIGITSLGAPVVALDTVGNPSHPVFSPDHNLPIGRELSFRDRVMSTVYSVYVRFYYHFVVLPREDRTVKKHFGENMPYLGDIERNVSLLLLNRNPVLHKTMPVVPAVIELGRIKRKQKISKLNQELKKFLDESSQGVIYLSYGSSLLSKQLPDYMIESLIETFSQIPYNVVWKWEDDILENKPKNVFIQKWIPQEALLSHPNVKLFIMQGGLQSMEEAINHHVPIIGMPSHSDQNMNVDTAVKFGFGILIEFEDLNVNNLKNAIMEIMNNHDKYKSNVIHTEKLMNDLPGDGLKKAIWWIEYILRHKGAKHLRSPSTDIPYYQYFLLDVFAFLLLMLIILIYVPYKLIRMLISSCWTLKQSDVKKKRD